MISPAKRAFQLAPKPFNGVGMDVSLDELQAKMPNRLMGESNLFKPLIDSQFIRIDRGVRFNILLNEGDNGFGSKVNGNGSFNVPVSPHDSQDGGFPRCASPSFPVRRTSSDVPSSHISLVHFYGAFKRRLRLFKEQTNLFRHAPRRFVGHSELPFQFFSRYPILGIGEKEDGIKPRFQRGIGLVEDRACKRMKLISTQLAGVALTLRNPVKFGLFVAVRTYFKQTVPLCKYVCKAGVVVGILGIKFLDRVFSHLLSPLGLQSDPLSIAEKLLAVKG